MPRRICRVTQPEADQLDKRRDVAVAARAAEQWGVVDLAELRASGLSAQAVSVRVTNARLHRLHRTVYAVGHANPPLEGRFLGALKACGPEAVLSHFSAAALWGFVEWDGRAIEVTLPGTATRLVPGVHVHRSLRLESRDTMRRRGIPVTSPARTVIDLAASLAQRPLRRAVRQALALRLVSVPLLARERLRLGRRRGAPKLTRVLAEAAPTRSELEDVVLDLIRAGGFAEPDVNVPLVLGGRRVVPDFRWPAQRLVIEADGARWHDDPLARADDRERQSLLERHGERVLRVTWKQAVGRAAETVERIDAAGAPRLST